MSSSSYLIDPDISHNIYRGEFFVFDASGGFTIEEGFSEIELNKIPIQRYDVTDAIQIAYSVRRFNDKIGIIKDENNNQVLDYIYWDPSEHMLTVDDITFTADEFLNTINTSSIISMGKMASLYSDFNYTVMSYFGDPLGWATLFAYNNFSVNGGVFDPSAYINLINGVTFDMSGTFITDLSGSFTIHGVNKNLEYACEYNLFNNRPTSENYDVEDGFMHGDLIFIPQGISVTLKINIQAEPYAHHHNFGPENLANDPSPQIQYTDASTNVYKVTTYSRTNITQTFTVPILLVLTDVDTFNMTQYGYNWTDVTTDVLGPKKWLAVSLSANGQFQSAVNSDGDIYISNDYGQTWETTFNIGSTMDGDELNESLSNCIAVSIDGSIQTACNGKQIFVSYDYGSTWDIKHTISFNQIFVCISLNGQYQTVLSCGDNIYSSGDYGETWTSIQDFNSGIYNSITAFQYAGISLSYSGKYQTIACEHIYISSDYGVTWNEGYVQDVFDVFDDRNWRGVSISSTGQYQTAVNYIGDIYISSSYGTNWNIVIDEDVDNKAWTGVSISANGRFQSAIDDLQGTVHMSIDYGQTWTSSPSTVIQNKNLEAISVSANGQYQTAVEDGGAIFISNLL